MLLRKSSLMNDSIDGPVPDNAKLIRMEDGPRSSVQFKPSKRMKKRRQLDALVASDKKLSRRKHSAHELLRSNNDSGSSEVDDFGVLQGHRLNKSWSSSSCCVTCCGLTVSLLVTCSVLACAALTWMHLQLRRDFTDLKDRVLIVENRHTASPEDVHELQTKLTAMDRALTNLRTGDSGLQALNKSITSMQAQIASLTAAQQQQQQSMQQAASGQDHNDVTKTVTDLGSDLQTTKAELKTLKDTQTSLSTDLTSLTDRLTELENPGGREGGSSVDTSGLQMQMTQMNSSLSQSIAQAVVDLNKLQTHIEAVDKFLQTLQGQMTSVQQLTTGLNHSQHIIMDTLGSFSTDSELTQIQTQVNDLHQTLEKGLLMLEQLKLGNTTEADPDLSSPPPSHDYFQELLRDHQDFLNFKAEMFQDISSLNVSMSMMNVSVEGVRKEVGELSDMVNRTVANVTDLTHSVHQVLASLPDDSKTTKLPPRK